MIACARSVLVSLSAIALFVTTLTSTALAQPPAALRVRVIDPLAATIRGARVSVAARSAEVRLMVVTDDTGVGSFDRLAPGGYLIEVDAAGFARPEPVHVDLRRGEVREITVTATLAGVNDYIVVTAAGTPQPAGDVSKTARVVDSAEMDARVDRTIADALRTVPGLRIQQLGGLGAATSINVRGLRNEDTALLIDGVRVRDAGATQGDVSSFLSDLLLTNVDRIEVLRGSGSSLYGSHAIGGVLNVITQPGAGPIAGDLIVEGGGLGTTRARAHIGGSLASHRVTYRAGVARLNVSAGVDGNDEAENTSAHAEIGVVVGQSARLSARFHGADAATMINEGPTALGLLPPRAIVPARPLAAAELSRYESGAAIGGLIVGNATFIPSANDPDNRRTSALRSTLVKLAQQTPGRLGYVVSFHDVATSRTFHDGPLGVSGFEPTQPTRADFDGRIQTLSARAHVQIGSRQLVTTGYEFEREEYSSESSATGTVIGSTADVIERSHTVFVQDQVSLTSTLEITGAFRAQIFALHAPRFTPTDRAPYRTLTFDAPPVASTGDASAVYAWPDAHTRVRAHLGAGYRAPSLFERFGSTFGRRGYSVYGDPRLAPERSVAVDGGVDHDLARGRLRLSATAFGTRLRDVIVFDFSGAITPATDPFGRSSGYRTTDRLTSRGLELQVAVLPASGTKVDGTYTYALATPRAAGPPEATQASVIPRHQVSVAIVQRLGAPLHVSVDVAISSGHLATLLDPVTFAGRAFRFSGMRRTNLAAVYTRPLVRRTRVRLFGRVDDLFGSVSYESGFRTPGRWGTAGAGIEF